MNDGLWLEGRAEDLCFYVSATGDFRSGRYYHIQDAIKDKPTIDKYTDRFDFTKQLTPTNLIKWSE